MYNDGTRENLKIVVCRTVIEGAGYSCSAIRNYLRRSFEPSPVIKKEFEGSAAIKEKQAEYLREYCKHIDFWLTTLLKDGVYLTHGGDAKVYFNGEHKSVLKLKDIVYYQPGSNFLIVLLFTTCCLQK